MDNENQFSYNMNDEPIVIFSIVSDIFLNQKNPAELMALYWFHRHEAKYSASGFSPANTAKKLKWSRDKVFQISKQLEKLGIIEDKGTHLHINI